MKEYDPRIEEQDEQHEIIEDKQPNDRIIDDKINPNSLGLVGTTFDQMNRMENIYSSLNTDDEKMDFLCMNRQYIESKDMSEGGSGFGFLPNVAHKAEQLEIHFIQSFMLRAKTEADMEKSFRTIGRWRAKLEMDIQDEMKKQMKEIPENDKYQYEKAYYRARKRHDIDVRFRMVSRLEKHLYDLYEGNEKFKGELKTKLDPSTLSSVTVSYLAHRLGYSGNALEFFKEEEHAFYLDRKASSHYFPANFDKPGVLEGKVMMPRAQIWIASGRDDLFNERGVAAEQRKDLDKISKQGTMGSAVEPSDYKIEAWASEERRKATERYKADYPIIAGNYHDRYVVPLQSRQKESHRRFYSYQRIHAEGSYDWIVTTKRLNDAYSATKPTEDQMAELKTDTFLDLAANTEKWLEKNTREMNRAFSDPEILAQIKNVVPHANKDNVNWLFTVWALGQPQNSGISIDADRISEIHNNPILVSKFAQYCKDHPTYTAKDERSYERSVKDWADIFERATEKIRKYKLPEIDPSNPERSEAALRAFAKLYSLCENNGSELKYCFQNQLGKDPVQTAEKMMGTGKWANTMNTWSLFTELMSAAKLGYRTETRLLGNSNKIFQKMSGIAANRMIAGEILNAHAGKDIGTIINEEKQNLPMWRIMGNEFYEKFYDSYGRRNPKYKKQPQIPREDFINYLTGKDTEAFPTKFKPFLDQARKDLKSELESVNSEAHVRFLKDLDFRNTKELILAVPDDAQAVQNFIRDGNTIQLDNQTKLRKGDYVGSMFNGLFTGSFSALLREAGIQNRMDVFQIGGKTPGELWGAKYANVADANLREKCLMFEVLKKIAAGNTEIRIKNIAPDKNGGFSVNGSRTLIPTADMMKRLNHNQLMYRHAMDDKILYLLQREQNTLLTTHPGYDPQKMDNIPDEIPNIGRVGSGAFRSFEEALDKCIRIMKNKNNSKPADIQAAMQRLQKTAADYYRIKKPMIGEGTAVDTNPRLITAKRIADFIPQASARYNFFREGIRLDGAFEHGFTMDNVPEGELEKRIELLNSPGLKNVLGLNGEKLSYAETDDRFRKYDAILMTLASGMKQIGKDMEKLLKPTKNPDPYDAAVSYYLKSAIDKALDDKLTLVQLDQRQMRLERFIKYGDFQKKADSLAKNPVFREFLRKNKAMDYRKWNELRNESENYVQQLKNDMQTVDGQNKDVARYVLTGLADAGQMKLSAGNLKTNPEETRYNRLGDYVTRQLLTDPKYESVANAICAKYMTYDEIRNNVTAGLKTHNIFEKGTYNDEGRLREMITSGKLKNMVTDTILRQMTAKAKAQGRQLGAANAPQGAVNQQNNPQAPGMHI